MHLYTCIIKMKAMDFPLLETKYLIWVRASDENFGKVIQNKKLRRIKKREQKILHFTPSERNERGKFLVRYFRVKS